MVTDCFGDLLRVDRTLARRADREFIETFACPAVVLRRLVQVPAMFLLQLGNQEDTKVLGMAGEAFATGLTLGLAAPEAAGADLAVETGTTSVAARVLTVGWMNNRPTGDASPADPTRVNAPRVMVGMGLNRICTM